MKLHKVLSSVLAGALLVSVMSACGGSPAATPTPTQAPAANPGTNAPSTDGTATPEPAAAAPAWYDSYGLTQDENGNLKFPGAPVPLTVMVYDRSGTGDSNNPEDNTYTDYIKQHMLDEHNVSVTFKSTPRWGEENDIENNMASGDVPNVCVTYNEPCIASYAEQGVVYDLSKYTADPNTLQLFPNLWELSGNTFINWSKDPATGSLYRIQAKLEGMNQIRLNTFMRQDWLDTLKLSTPTTVDEFEACLQAFKDNATTLLGADADKLICYEVTYDAGWTAGTLLDSFIPNDITDKDYYINGYDDRHFTEPGVKEGVRKLNDWYNKGLLWTDFATHLQGDSTMDNNVKAGYVGAYTQAADYPYKSGSSGSMIDNLKTATGNDNAMLIAVNPFPNDAGIYRKWQSGGVDRKVFMPTLSQNMNDTTALAGMLYLDFLCQPDTIFFLQAGVEGVTYTVNDDGSLSFMATTADSRDYINSQNNIDYTILLNGLDLGDPDLAAKSMGSTYPGIDPSVIATAYNIGMTGDRSLGNVQAGTIVSEGGMSKPLADARNAAFAQAISTTPDQFDSVWDSMMQTYLSIGGQAIMDERKAAWESIYGDATMLPGNTIPN